MLKSKISVVGYEENGKTLLGDSYHNAPYKIIHYGSKNLRDHLEMIMMCASPGMMEGDELDIDVEVNKSAQMRLYTQSFSKIHPTGDVGAVQRMNVRIQEKGLFHFIPHPVTPFHDSTFRTTNTIHMQPDSTLIWGDIIASGRVHVGESFDFNLLHSVTKIYRGKKLIVMDNQRLTPKKHNLQSILYYEGFTHQATLIYVSPFGDLLKEELDEILAGQYQEITFGFTQCAPDAVMIRAMGNDGELLYEWLSEMGRLCWSFTQFQLEQEKKLQQEGLEPMDDAETALKDQAYA
jgi:urease accessory protein